MLARAMRDGKIVGPYTNRIENMIAHHELAQDIETIKTSCYDEILASRKDLTNSVKEFCKQNPHDADAQTINRWIKAVSFKMVKNLYASERVTVRNKHVAITATPTEAAELCYIDPSFKAEYEEIARKMREAGIGCMKFTTEFYQEKLTAAFARVQVKIQEKIKKSDSK